MKIIFVLFIAFLSSVVANEKVIYCYYGTWATYRWWLGKFDIDNIKPELCTHLVYAFVGIDYEGNVISLDPGLDFADNFGRDNLRKFNDLKQKNNKLKTILAVGGWNEGSYKYSLMAASQSLRRNFITSALVMVIEYGFDGLDLDWEYPSRRDSANGAADIDNFTLLVKELREEFNKHGLLLTAAVAAVADAAVLSYNIPEISKYLDYIGLMTYDMYGAWDPVTGHNSPLHKGEGDGDTPRENLYTLDVAMEYWLGQGCPAHKLLIGIPFYGRTFTLANGNVKFVRAPASGPGISGQYTATSGYIGYNEFCVRLQSETWENHYDGLAKVPYAVLDKNWVSYDNADSITEKIKYSQRSGIGGVIIWSIETDDFHGLCGQDFPLLRTINKALGKDENETLTTSAPSTQTTPTIEVQTTELPTTTAKPTLTTEYTTTTTPRTTVTIERTTTAEQTIPTELTTPTTPSTEAVIQTEPAITTVITSTVVLTETTTVAPSTSTSITMSTTTGSSIPTSTTSTTTESSVPSNDICKEEGVTYNPKNCATFIICVKQADNTLKPNVFSCPGTLLFDQVNMVCNYPQYVDCHVAKMVDIISVMNSN